MAYQTLQKLDEFETHHVADLVTAYAIMVHHPGDLLLRLTAHIYTRLENMSAGAVEALLLCPKGQERGGGVAVRGGAAGNRTQKCCCRDLGDISAVEGCLEAAARSIL